MVTKLNCFFRNILLIIPLSITLLRCSERKAGETKSSKKDVINSVSVQEVDELVFRRSYSGGIEPLSDKEVEKIRRSNPEPGYWNDTTLIDRLYKLGIVNKKHELLLKKFKPNDSKDFQLIAKEKENISCRIVRSINPNTPDLYDLVVNRGNEQTKIQIEGHYGYLNEDIKYLLLDVIPGGYKEFVVLYEYYISNGDNSVILIYEIKS